MHPDLSARAAVVEVTVGPATPAAPVVLVLCVITFRRPAGLRRCLDAIAALDPPSSRPVDVRVVVVDNEPSGPCRGVVEAATARLDGAAPPIGYAIEPEGGIPYARNRAVRMAAEAGADVIGFLDDDEVPRADWLSAMVDTWAASGADVAQGRSEPVFEMDPPGWLHDGRFFASPPFVTGQSVDFYHCRTSGVLISTAALPSLTTPFDTNFRYSGGSDHHLFRTMAGRGARFVWVDDAAVEVHVPPARARGRWLVRRAFRIGNTRSLSLVAEGVAWPRRVARAGKGMLQMGRGAAGLAVVVVRRRGRDRVATVRGLQRVALGAGLVAGAAGWAYEEYQRDDSAVGRRSR